MKMKILNADLISDIVGELEGFPKYTTQLINLANQNAQGTRPKIVGQMSDLIQEFPENNYSDWVTWYQNKMPQAIEDATEKIYAMIANLKRVLSVILPHDRAETLLSQPIQLESSKSSWNPRFMAAAIVHPRY